MCPGFDINLQQHWLLRENLTWGQSLLPKVGLLIIKASRYPVPKSFAFHLSLNESAKIMKILESG